MTVEELDFLYDEDANSIEMLVAHMETVERAYHILSFENRDITEAEISILNPGLELGTEGREKIK